MEPPRVRAGTVVRALTVLFWMTKTLRMRRPRRRMAAAAWMKSAAGSTVKP